MQTISDGKIFHIIGEIYDNAKNGSPQSWLRIYKAISAMLSSGPGGISLYMTDADTFRILAGTLDPALVKQYDEHYQHVSPFRDIVAKMRPGQYFSRSQTMDDDVFETTEIYRDYFRKQDIYEYEYHTLCDVNNLTGGLSFSRPPNRKQFSKQERLVIKHLIPHLQRGFQFYLVLNQANGLNVRMIETLNHIKQGVILINQKGKIVFSNAAAEVVLRTGDGIEVDRRGLLRANYPQETAELLRRVFSVFNPIMGGSGAELGGLLQIERSSGLRSLQLQIVPFAENELDIFAEEPMAMILVTDPEQRSCASEETLINIFRLTQAEARFALLIAKGLSLKEAAVPLQISENTARTHLKRIFSKTDTSRQSELVALIMNIPHVENL